tara:strand:+ start:84 stop:3386 length:3303 start_codon:yes stop_codon:yes gene_type:complete
MGIKIEEKPKGRAGPPARSDRAEIPTRSKRGGKRGRNRGRPSGLRYSERNPEGFYDLNQSSTPLTEEELQQVADGELSSVLVNNDTLRKLIKQKYNLRQDQEGAIRSLYKMIPTNLRLLMENLVGADDVITAADFTEDELVEMLVMARRQQDRNKFDEESIQEIVNDPRASAKTVEEGKAMLASFEDTRGKTSINPYRPGLVDAGFLDSAYKSFADPEYTVATSLGKFNVFDRPESPTTTIVDEYNFNKQERNRKTDFISVLKNSIASPELAGEYLANFLGTEDRQVMIELPKRVGMQSGGTVDDTRLGNYLTPEEYQTRFVDFYDMPGIKVEKAPDPADPDPDPPVTRPNILEAVESDSETNIFSGINMKTGQPAFKLGKVDYNEYIKNFDKNTETAGKKGEDKSLSGFGDWVAKNLKTPEMAIGTPVGMAMGNPALGGFMLAAGAMNRKKQYENATKIAASGGTGGSMFKINNQTISRAPGSRIYSGTLGGLTQEQVGRVEAINMGFIPGTMDENPSGREDESGSYNKTGKSGLVSIDGAIMDAYGNIHSAAGPQMATASQAEALREKLYVEAMTAAGYTINKETLAADALAMKQALNAAARGGIGPFTTVRRQDAGVYSTNLSGSQQFIKDYLEERHGKKKAAPTTSGGPAPDPRQGGGEGGIPQSTPSGDSDSDGGSDASQSAGLSRDNESDGGYSPGGTGGGRSDYQGGYSGFTSQGPTDGYGGGSMGGRAMGGRVGMQAGGVAAQPPAGFVERPPSQVSEAATVADDKPMSVPEGTFVINAAAVEFAGEDDIKKMILDAYTKARQQGTFDVDRPLYEKAVDVAVSRGEVIVPPALAKIIGYDRLEKINNRGKKETSKRIKENGKGRKGAAGGGFLDGKKFAEGGEADYEDRIIADEVRRKMQELLGELPDDITVTFDAHRDNPKFKERVQKEADAMGMLPLAGHYYSNPETKTISVPQTPTLFNLYVMAEEIAHQDYLSKRQENPYKGFSGFVDENNRKFGSSRDAFDHYEAFEREQRYLEEMRAKSIAYETVKDLLPKGKKTAEYFRQGYEEDFARYIYDTAPELVRKGIYDKYQELQKYVDDKGRFVSHKKK